MLDTSHGFQILLPGNLFILCHTKIGLDLLKDFVHLLLGKRAFSKFLCYEAFEVGWKADRATSSAQCAAGILKDALADMFIPLTCGVLQHLLSRVILQQPFRLLLVVEHLGPVQCAGTPSEQTPSPCP